MESSWVEVVSKSDRKKRGSNSGSPRLAEGDFEFNQDPCWDEAPSEEEPDNPHNTVHLRPDKPQLEEGHSSNPKTKSPYASPWVRIAEHFHEQPTFHRSDLSLPSFNLANKDFGLVLEETDYLPITKGWGYCLIGMFAGRFPGKDSVYNLMKRWPRKALVSFHDNGWMLFQFENENDREVTQQLGPFVVFGIPLITHNLPSDFRFNAAIN